MSPAGVARQISLDSCNVGLWRVKIYRGHNSVIQFLASILCGIPALRELLPWQETAVSLKKTARFEDGPGCSEPTTDTSRQQDGSFATHLSGTARLSRQSRAKKASLPFPRALQPYRFLGFNMASPGSDARLATPRHPSHPARSGGAECGAKMAAESEYESVLCVKPDVSVYRIPPRASNRGYRYAGAGGLLPVPCQPGVPARWPGGWRQPCRLRCWL